MKKILPVLRFLFGLVILGWLFWGIPTLTHQSPIFIMMVSVSTLAPFALPLILAAGYFLFTGRFRWRFDIIALIIAVFCSIALSRMLNINLSFSKNGIKGEVKLEVTILREENSQPLADLEVDVAEKPGQPPEGGVSKTNQNGVAVFYLKPNTYTIYFNSNNFPSNLKQPENFVQVKVEKDRINQQTILLKEN